MASHSSTLAWRIPWTRSLAGCSPWGPEWARLRTAEHVVVVSTTLCISVVSVVISPFSFLILLIWVLSLFFFLDESG